MRMRSKNPGGHVAGRTGSSTMASPWRRTETVSPSTRNSSRNLTNWEPSARMISATFMEFPRPEEGRENGDAVKIAVDW